MGCLTATPTLGSEDVHTQIQRGNIGAVPVDSRTQLCPAVGTQMDIASTGGRGCGRVT